MSEEARDPEAHRAAMKKLKAEQDAKAAHRGSRPRAQY